MKEYLTKNNHGNYELVYQKWRNDDIEVPEGAEKATICGDYLIFWKLGYLSFSIKEEGDWVDAIKYPNRYFKFDEYMKGHSEAIIVWQRHTQPEELPFIDDEPKEYLREDGNGSYILELTCKQEATEPHAKHWIEVPVGLNFYYSFASGDKVFTKEHSSLGRLLWQRKPPFSINDQYAEIEQVRKQIVEATLAERQAQYGCFEDVARTTGKIMEALSEVRVNGLNDLPYPHRMALYMIASKMARIVNGDFNHKDGWHDIGGYSKLVEDLL